MFRAFGLVIVLWYLSTLFQSSFIAFDNAATATFNAVEEAARVTELEFE
jgi:hypothetical protein